LKTELFPNPHNNRRKGISPVDVYSEDENDFEVELKNVPELYQYRKNLIN
jgi:hypothetical protein